MLIPAKDIAAQCYNHGIHFHSGVPCSLLSPVTNTISTAENMRYINATSEGEAIAIAAGAWLAGQQAGIWIQNSGLGNTINPVTSLLAPFAIPVLYVVSRRGKPGVSDEPQHELMGQITPDILKFCGIDHAFLEEEQENLDELFTKMKSQLDDRKSYGLVIDKGCVEKAPYVHTQHKSYAKRGLVKDFTTQNNKKLSSRYQILETIAAKCDRHIPIIATTGKTGRELFTIRDSANHFYMVGSMGYASSIGLGVAMNSPKKTVVIDGDGALLMNMGTLATIGHFAPKNFVHIVIDNGLYESTGGQPTTSETVDFAQIAHHCGYAEAYSVDDLQDLDAILADWIHPDKELSGPCLVCVKASVDKIEDLARPDIHPKDVAARFKEFLSRDSL